MNDERYAIQSDPACGFCHGAGRVYLYSRHALVRCECTRATPAAPAPAPAPAPTPAPDRTRRDLYADAYRALVVPLCATCATPEEAREIRAAGRALVAIFLELHADARARDAVVTALRAEAAVAAEARYNVLLGGYPEANGYARGLARALALLEGAK